MKKLNVFFSVATLAFFAGMLLLPTVNDYFPIIKKDTGNENRNKAPKPDYESMGFDKYVKAYDAYYTDNFNLRENFIAFLNRFEYTFYGVSAVPNDVLIGKDGWFFERKSVPNYKGANLFSREEMAELSNELKLRTAWAAQRGIKYYVALVPNKMNIYPEFLPSRVIRLSDSTRYDQVVALDHRPDINVIDIRKNLLKHKNDGEFLYQHTDDHWNELGCFYGYQAIMQRLNLDFPELGVLSIGDYSLVTEKRPGDLSKMLNEEDNHPENFIRLVEKKPVFARDGVKRDYPVPKSISDWDYQIVKVNDHGKRLKCLIIRDSFTFLMVKFLQEHFRETVFIHDEWKYRMREDLIEKEKPDIVLNIILETEVHKLLQYPFTPVPQHLHIQCTSGKYLNVGDHTFITTTADSAFASTSLILIRLDDDKYAIQYNGLYISADHAQDDKLIANREAIGAWEMFTIIKLPDGNVAFKADNGKYVSINEKTGQAYSTSDAIGPQETFKILTSPKNRLLIN